MTDKHSTSDILTRLRAMAADKALAIGEAWNGLNDAADEIEWLRAENDALREVAAEAELNREGLRVAHAELAKLRARIEGAPVVKVRGRVGELAAIYVSHSLVGKRVALVVVND